MSGKCSDGELCAVQTSGKVNNKRFEAAQTFNVGCGERVVLLLRNLAALAAASCGLRVLSLANGTPQLRRGTAHGAGQLS